MKHGKKPNLVQKKMLQKKGLNADNWLIIKNLQEYMVIMHRDTGKVRVFPKGGQEA